MRRLGCLSLAAGALVALCAFCLEQNKDSSTERRAWLRISLSDRVSLSNLRGDASLLPPPRGFPHEGVRQSWQEAFPKASIAESKFEETDDGIAISESLHDLYGRDKWGRQAAEESAIPGARQELPRISSSLLAAIQSKGHEIPASAVKHSNIGIKEPQRRAQHLGDDGIGALGGSHPAAKQQQLKVSLAVPISPGTLAGRPPVFKQQPKISLAVPISREELASTDVISEAVPVSAATSYPAQPSVQDPRIKVPAVSAGAFPDHNVHGVENEAVSEAASAEMQRRTEAAAEEAEEANAERLAAAKRHGQQVQLFAKKAWAAAALAEARSRMYIENEIQRPEMTAQAQLMLRTLRFSFRI
jgi:hypothetical protein